MKRPLRVALCFSMVPFDSGGAEILVEGIYQQLKKRGYRVEIVSIPFKWYPPEEIIRHSLVWRLIDLEESNGKRIDMVIGTKFPSYLVRHRNKVIWLFHQFRQAYDLYGTDYSDLDQSKKSRRVRNAIIKMDETAFAEAQAIYANSKTVADRLKKFNGITAEPLYSPPRLKDRFYNKKYGDYILSVGRLDILKRHDLLIKSLNYCDKKVRAVIVGTGLQEKALRGLAEKEGVASRVTFAGWVKDNQLLELYAEARGVYFAPIDEDYGYVTLEAFLSHKPVVSCFGSGGVLEFVKHEKNGLLVPPSDKNIGAAFDRLFASSAYCCELGDVGRKTVEWISWDSAIDRLTMSLSNEL